MKKLFTQHPESVGETYVEHLQIASKSGFKLVVAGFACLIHSIFPFLFITTASRTVQEINQKMVARQAALKNQ